MSAWSWCFEPSDLVEGSPVGAVAEIGRSASEPAAMGAGAGRAGHPRDRSGGLREFPPGDGAGFLPFPAAHRLQEIVTARAALWPQEE